MEWYNKGILQSPPPPPIPRTLHHLCLRCIHDNFSIIPSLANLPTHIMQQVQHFMMQGRSMGSRLLNDTNVHKLLVPNIEELNLSGFWVVDQPFLDHFNCPFLTYLNLSALVKICASSPNLKVILLKGVHQLQAGSALAIAQNCKDLQVLTISCGKFIGNEILDVFASCTNLTLLKLYRAEAVNPNELVKRIIKLPNLETFSLEKCNITDEAFAQLLTCKNLRVLKISGSQVLVGADVASVAASKLQKLTFDECHKLTTLSKILPLCPQLTALHLCTCKKVTDTTIIDLALLPHTLSQMVSFSIRTNNKVTDASVLLVAKHFSSNLKELDFTGCTKLLGILWTPNKDDGTEFKNYLQNLACLILDSCKSIQVFNAESPGIILPALVHLDLSSVTITDAALIKLITPMESLHTLNLRFSNHLTGAFLLEISQSQLVPSLLKLQLSNSIGYRLSFLYPQLNFKGSPQPLQIVSPSLKFLEFSYTLPTVIHIDCPNLEILDFSGNNLTADNLIENVQRMPKLTNFWARGQKNFNGNVMRTLAGVCPNLQAMDVRATGLEYEALEGVLPQLKNVYRIYYHQSSESEQQKTLNMHRTVNSVVL